MHPVFFKETKLQNSGALLRKVPVSSGDDHQTKIEDLIERAVRVLQQSNRLKKQRRKEGPIEKSEIADITENAKPMTRTEIKVLNGESAEKSANALQTKPNGE